jgi:hypothetical protein
MVVLDLCCLEQHQPITPWQTLRKHEPAQESVPLNSTVNTKPCANEDRLPRALLYDWEMSRFDPFPDMNELEAYARDDPKIWQALNTQLRAKDYPLIITGYYWSAVCETAVEINLKTHFDIVNLALQKTAINGHHLVIRHGPAATKGDKERKLTSIPDRAGYQVSLPTPEDGSAYVIGLPDNTAKGPMKYRNLVPGEIKIYHKFRRQFLDATATMYDRKRRIYIPIDRPDKHKREEAEKVFTQIYQYLNERDCAIGYVISDQELICVRRVDEQRYGSWYGCMDISRAIPLSAAEGDMNAKLALWYLHHKYGMRYPKLGQLRRTLKPRDWHEMNQKIRDGVISADFLG